MAQEAEMESKRPKGDFRWPPPFSSVRASGFETLLRASRILGLRGVRWFWGFRGLEGLISLPQQPRPTAACPAALPYAALPCLCPSALPCPPLPSGCQQVHRILETPPGSSHHRRTRRCLSHCGLPISEAAASQPPPGPQCRNHGQRLAWSRTASRPSNPEPCCKCT